MASTQSSLQAGKGNGHISEDIQQQAKKVTSKNSQSPVVSEFLIGAKKGFTEHVLQALKEGGSARAAATDKHGRNCLHLACLHGHFDTALGILQTQLVDINGVNKRGLTALHDACTEGHTRVALLLLAMGAYVMSRTKDGWTCLMCACSNGHLQLAQFVLAAGCDIDAYTKLSLTALHIAAWKGHAPLVDILIRSRCNVLAQTHNGKTALQLAQEENQHEAVIMLQGATSKQSEEPMYRISALEGQVRICQEKLVEARRKHDELMTKEQLRNSEKILTLKMQHTAEVENMTQKTNNLNEKISELERCLEKSLAKSAPKVTVEMPSPPPPLSHRSRKIKAKAENKEKKNSIEANQISADIDPLAIGAARDDNRGSAKTRPKSASYNDLTSIGKVAEENSLRISDHPNRGDHDLDRHVTRQSSENYKQIIYTPVRSKKALANRPSLQDEYDSIRRSSTPNQLGQKNKINLETSPSLSSSKKTITELVAESLSHPGSMSAIRKELKSDSFTPKIQRKFPRNSSLNTSLPTMSPNTSSTSINNLSTSSVGSNCEVSSPNQLTKSKDSSPRGSMKNYEMMANS